MPAPLARVFWPPILQRDHIDAESLSGHYATAAGLVELVDGNKGLQAKLRGRKFRLKPRREGGLLYLQYRLFGIIPIPLGNLGNLGISLRRVDGNDLLISTNTLGMHTLVGVKIQPHPISPAWQQRLGAYTLVKPLEVAEIPTGGITQRDGFLVAWARIKGVEKLELVLQPVDDNRAKVVGFGRGLGEYVHVVEAGNCAQLSFSNIIFQKDC